MRVRVLPSTVGGGLGQHLAGLLVDDRLALDAGSVGLFGTVAEQAAVRAVLLTHAHLDHVASLPVLLDNVYQLADRPPDVYALPATLDALRADLFNDRLWPDFVRLSETLPPFLRLCPVRPRRAFAVAGYRVTAVPADHPVPTVGYLVQADDGAAVGYVTDTRSAAPVADMLARCPGLRTVFLEASFPTALADLAATTGHLTASQFLAAARSAGPGVRFLAVHIKPRYWAEVTAELAAAKLANVTVAASGAVVEVRPTPEVVRK